MRLSSPKFSTAWGSAALTAAAFLFAAPHSANAATVCQTDPVAQPTDFVFLMDASPSMCQYIQSIATGLTQLVGQLNDGGVDARFAIVAFGGAPRLLQSFSVSLYGRVGWLVG